MLRKATWSHGKVDILEMQNRVQETLSDPRPAAGWDYSFIKNR